MIIESRTGANRLVEARSDFGSSVPPTWAMMSGNLAPDGRIVTSNVAVSIPTVVGALTLISGSAASLPIQIFDGTPGDKEPIYDAWQYTILESYPGPDTDPFQFKFDVFWCLEAFGNAFILKSKNKKGIPEELIVLDPERVRIRNDNGTKVFDIRVGDNQEFRGATANEILHIKNLPKHGSMFTGTCGLKLIAARLGAELSATEWEGRTFMNNAQPPVAIILGDDAGVDEMKEAYDSWMVSHAGTYNAGKPAVLSGGATIEKLGYNMQEMQMIDAHNFNVLDICRAMNVPLTMFIPPHTKPQGAEDEALVFNTFYMGPRYRRVESAFNSDPDFFAFEKLYMRFDERSMVRTSVLSQAAAFHDYVQDGVLVPDEVRAELGYMPLEPLMSPEDASNNPGKIPQLTPVGGAPNPSLSKDLLLTKQVNESNDNSGSR